MSENDNIVQALYALDPANDDHWTADGLPRLDALPSGLSRKMVTDALPGFNRSKAAEPPAPAPDAQAQADQDGDDETEGDEDGLADADDGLDRAHVELEDAEAEAAEAEAAFEEARKKREAAIAKRDAILEAHADTTPHHIKVVSDIQEYLEAQQADREQRQVARQAALKAIGGQTNLLTGKAPIDNAMARKTGRGRPTFNPQG